MKKPAISAKPGTASHIAVVLILAILLLLFLFATSPGKAILSLLF